MELTQPRPRSIARPRIRAILGALGALAAGLILGALLLAVVATTSLGYRVLDVASGSMVPALQRGDLILSRPAPIDQVKQGDVIVFQEGEKIPVLVAHRVAAITNLTVNATSKSTGRTTVSTTQLLRTKGDANPLPDPQAVDAAHYRGIVWLILPGLGVPLLGYPVSHIFLGIAALTAFLWACYELIGLVRRRRGGHAISPAAEEHSGNG